MKPIREQHLGQEAAAGFAAGITGTVIGYPLDLVKTRLQTGNSSGSSFRQVAGSIVHQEGYPALFKGISPSLISLTILGTVTFTQYSFFRELFNANPGWDYRNFFAGIVCAPVNGIFSTMETLLKTQMQLDNVTKKEFNGSLQCAKTLVSRHGPRIVYTGHAVNTMREATFLGHFFFAYEGLRATFIEFHILPIHIAVPVAGGFSGAIGWLASFPLDCVRAGVQGQVLPPQKSAVQLFRDLVAERGIRGLYAGAGVSIARAFLVSGCRFSAYELTLWALRGGRHYEKHHD